MSKKSESPENGKGTCFVIMPIGELEGREDSHFKKVYDQIFKPAIEEAGYCPKRADDDCTSHLIQAGIISDLIEAPMAICDLSTRNPNVLYELGIRHAFDKPVILVQESGTERIFDISGINTVEYRPKRLFDEVIEDRRKIQAAIEETAKDDTAKPSLIKLVKVAAATYDDVKVTNEDKMAVMLSGIMNELQEMKRQNYTYRYSISQDVLNEPKHIDRIYYSNFDADQRAIKRAINEIDNKISHLEKLYDSNQMDDKERSSINQIIVDLEQWMDQNPHSSNKYELQKHIDRCKRLIIRSA